MALNHHHVVHKFGGSSLIDAESFKTVGNRLTGKDEIIVVSATKGTNSALQVILDKAAGGENFQLDLEVIEEKHRLIIQSLLANEQAIPLLELFVIRLPDIALLSSAIIPVPELLLVMTLSEIIFLSSTSTPP